MSNNTILVVDDDPEVLAFHKKIFSAPRDAEFDILGSRDVLCGTGLTCLAFSDPHELLREYSEKVRNGRQYPLCIIDMRMPVMSGLMVAHRIRELDPDILIVICTAFSDISPEELSEKLQTGVFFVRKPFVADEFVLLIQSLVGNWNAHRDLERTQTLLATQCGKLEQVLEGTRAGTWDWDIPEGKLEFNELWAEMLGYQLSELQPADISTWVRLCHPDDLVRSNELLLKAFTGENAYYDCECRMRHKDGHWVWIWDRGKVTEWSPDGKALRAAGTHSDISEVKRHLEALAKSESRLQDVIASAGEYVWEVDTEAKFTYLSPRVQETLGRPVSEILGHTPIDFCLEEDKPFMIRFVQDQFAKKMPFEKFRHRSLRPDGSVVHQQINGRPVFLPDGEFCGFIGMSMDVTEEENAKHDLVKVRERIEMFFEVAIDLLCITDLEGRFVRVSRAWEDFLELSAESLEGRVYMDFVHPDDLETTNTVLENLKRAEPVIGFVNRYRSGSGEWRYIEWRAKLVQGFVFAAARDVTHANATQSALERALESERQTTELKSRLVSMASHEFRTPLATIRLAADILSSSRDLLDENGIQRSLEMILETTDFMTEIVTDVLDLSSIVRSSEKEELSEIPLPEFLAQIAEGFCQAAQNPGLVSFEYDGLDVTVPGIPALLRRAVNNLLNNAVKYSPAGKPIVMLLRCSEQQIEIQVLDRGIGMPEEEMVLLQTPFFRASNTTGIPGTGLGLAIASEAMQRMGGDVVCAKRSGGGSIFTLRLPCSAKCE